MGLSSEPDVGMLRAFFTAEHFAIISNRKLAVEFFVYRIFCAEPAAIPDRGRGQVSAENAQGLR
jgi:hypothetical protein